MKKFPKGFYNKTENELNVNQYSRNEFKDSIKSNETPQFIEEKNSKINLIF